MDSMKRENGTTTPLKIMRGLGPRASNRPPATLATTKASKRNRFKSIAIVKEQIVARNSPGKKTYGYITQKPERYQSWRLM
jgi:hypothetical protein